MPHLETEIFLAQRYPIATQYQQSVVSSKRRCRWRHLHGNESIVHEDFFGKEIGTNGGFVACAELLIDLQENEELVLDSRLHYRRKITYILVHQGRLSHTTVAKDNDLVRVSIAHWLPTRLIQRTFRRAFFREAIIMIDVCRVFKDYGVVVVGVDRETDRQTRQDRGEMQ
jgi:hypothetical protein